MMKDRSFFDKFSYNLMREAGKIDLERISYLEGLGNNHKQKHLGWDEFSYWYGAKVDVRHQDSPHPNANNMYFGGPDTVLFVKNPALISGMFIRLTKCLPHSNEEGGFDHFERLNFYNHAALLVKSHQEKNRSFDIYFIRYFFQFIAMAMSKVVGKIELLLEQNDETRRFCQKEHDNLTSQKQTQYYFAFGSNMCPVQMHHRCPGAKPVGIARIENYRLIINTRGVASIIDDDGSRCYGILWAVTSKHIKSLDECEGVEFGTYQRKNMVVQIQNRNFNAHVYIASNKTEGAPREDYLSKLESGIDFFGGHEEWLQEVLSWELDDCV